MEATQAFARWLAGAAAIPNAAAEELALALQEAPAPYFAYAPRPGLPPRGLLRGENVVPLWALSAQPPQAQPLLSARQAEVVRGHFCAALAGGDWPALFAALYRDVPEVSVIVYFRHPLEAVADDFRAGATPWYWRGGAPDAMAANAAAAAVAANAAAVVAGESVWAGGCGAPRRAPLLFHVLALPFVGAPAAVALAFFSAPAGDAEDLSARMRALTLEGSRRPGPSDLEGPWCPAASPPDG